MDRLPANWSAPPNVFAFTTLRNPGFSKAAFAHNNLALHVGDNDTDVMLNRQQLNTVVTSAKSILWLEQTHSNQCILAETTDHYTADAIITRTSEQALAILTADCLPILLCNLQGNEVAAIHAGWRGLVNGIIENTVVQMTTHAAKLIAWIGPAICQACFEVGAEVLQLYQHHYSFASQEFHSVHTQQGIRWQANLPKLAERILNNLGILSVYQANACTFEQRNNFYSYRRDAQTGRMATLIWFS